MADVVRDPGPDAGGVSIVIATNVQNRVEPFAFEDRASAERFADHIKGLGHINLALVYHGVEILDELSAQRVTFRLREALP